MPTHGIQMVVATAVMLITENDDVEIVKMHLEDEFNRRMEDIKKKTSATGLIVFTDMEMNG